MYLLIRGENSGHLKQVQTGAAVVPSFECRREKPCSLEEVNMGPKTYFEKRTSCDADGVVLLMHVSLIVLVLSNYFTPDINQRRGGHAVP